VMKKTNIPQGMTRRLYAIAIVLLVLALANSGVFIRYLLLSRGDARMINHLGQVRGQIQRVTKLYLSDAETEERIEEAMSVIDSKLANFAEMQETRFNLPGEGFEPFLIELQEAWSLLKELLVRETADEKRVLDISERAWTIADTSVIYLQHRSERERTFLYLSFITLVLLVGGILGTIIYIRRIIDQRIEYHALYDGLTGILNRTTLVDRLNSLIGVAKRYGRPFSVIMLDIDHFKRINDELGHPTGDRVLAGLSRRLSYNLRNMDIMFRYGGEEFLVVLPETSIDDALKTAEKLRSAVEERPIIDEVGISISCGVVAWQQTDDDARILERADQAMYRAKEEGRNRVATYRTEEE
jgi:diguanylate cyclase (GGDEF)-like protein